MNFVKDNIGKFQTIMMNLLNGLKKQENILIETKKLENNLVLNI